MKFYRQFDSMDCGPACVRMIASHFGRDIPLSYLRSVSQLTREGVTVAGIRNALSVIGIDSSAFQMSLTQLKDACPLPAIAYWEQHHFVIIERITSKNKYIICDPAFGRHSISQSEFEQHWLNGYNGVVIAVEPTKQFYEENDTTMRHSFYDFTRKYIWPFKSQIIQSILAMLVGMLFGLVSPFLTQAVVDQGIASKNLGLVFDILLAQLALFGGQFIMSVIGSWVSLYMTTHISISVLRDYLNKLILLPICFFDTKSIGDQQQRLGDHARIQSFMTSSSIETLFSLFSVPFYMSIISIYSPTIMIVFLLFTGISTIWIVYFFQRRKALDYEQFAMNSQNQTKIFELITGIIDIKINGYAKYKLDDWEGLQNKQYRLNCKVLRINQLQTTGFTIIGQVRNIIITYLIAIEVINGSLTLGMMMSMSMMIGMMSGPLGQLIGFLQQYQDAKISLERSQEVHLCNQEDINSHIEVPNEKPYDIELKNVSFSYAGFGGKQVISNVNLTIKAGQMTAIVGESGSGKSTLMKLLLKFYEPTSGVILLNEIPFGEFSALSLRNHCGIVMQDNYLFSDTLAQNIVMGEPFEKDRLLKAINTACLDNLINQHPLGINTKVGANGIGISGGEKQRIMIARAAYKNPLYIFMDEATSSLDAENEAIITNNIAKQFSKKTRIVIAHRLSTVKNADLIVVMQNGKIVETGVHQQLIEKKGYYFSLIQNQLELSL